jgi:hypothetical protein
MVPEPKYKKVRAVCETCKKVEQCEATDRVTGLIWLRNKGWKYIKKRGSGWWVCQTCQEVVR